MSIKFLMTLSLPCGTIHCRFARAAVFRKGKPWPGRRAVDAAEEQRLSIGHHYCGKGIAHAANSQFLSPKRNAATDQGMRPDTPVAIGGSRPHRAVTRSGADQVRGDRDTAPLACQTPAGAILRSWLPHRHKICHLPDRACYPPAPPCPCKAQRRPRPRPLQILLQGNCL